MTPLSTITGGYIDFARQHRARVAICQHVRGGGEIGPRWRRGSNARRCDPLEELWSGTFDPCHCCGADGGELQSWHHYERCPACGTEWAAGDYDWWQLRDVLRFKQDEEAGLIEDESARRIVHGFDVTTVEGNAAFREACAARRIEREGPVDHRAADDERRDLVQRVVAARAAGDRMEPLGPDASAGERAHWGGAFRRAYRLAISSRPHGTSGEPLEACPV